MKSEFLFGQGLFYQIISQQKHARLRFLYLTFHFKIQAQDSGTSYSTALDNGEIFPEGIGGNDVKETNALDNIEVPKPTSPSTSLLGEIQHQQSSNTFCVVLDLQDIITLVTPATNLGRDLSVTQKLKDKRYRLKMTSEFASLRKLLGLPAKVK